MKKSVKLICMIVVVVMVLGCAPLHVQAAGFAPMRDTNTDGTNIFAMGDCRAVAIFSMCKHKGASISQGAGHYKGMWSGGYVIDSNAQMSLMKKAVVKNLKKKGKATVFIMATLNIGNAWRSKPAPAVKAQLRPAKIAAGWTAKYKDRVVKPTVYVTSLVPKSGTSAASYNNCLKKYLKKNAYRSLNYIQISAKGGFSGDGIHLSHSGAKAIWNTMRKADKKTQIQYK